MTEYTKKILDNLGPEVDNIALTPAPSHLFDVNEECPILTKETAKLFHHIVAQLLFLAKRGRPDLLTAVAFLTARVTSPDKDGFKKLQCAIRYL